MLYDKPMRNNETCEVIVLGLAVIDITAYPADKALFDKDSSELEVIQMAAGGDAVNQAAMLSKLGHGVSLSCRVGDDAFGRLLIGEMAAHGIDIARISVSPDSVTGTTIVLVSKDGQRSFLCKRGNNRDFCIEDIDIARITQAKVLSVASLFALSGLEARGLPELLQHAKSKGLLTFADTMLRRKDAQRYKVLAAFHRLFAAQRGGKPCHNGQTKLSGCGAGADGRRCEMRGHQTR